MDTGFENGNHGVRLLALVRSRHSEDGKKQDLKLKMRKLTYTAFEIIILGYKVNIKVIASVLAEVFCVCIRLWWSLYMVMIVTGFGDQVCICVKSFCVAS